ncbi:hypothetical protein SAMN05444166_4932 [Singulisphaera sp. GP187]|uniref:hypothetical protein n=1 Tax=Singulisphaera sp. GP187 TaxID=1882752 RepID=UPI00092B10CF|nr:hypothetical protein [Singulisphaera sp. GP187]SIO46180.1 hypothetical protein SAMN05444166_4932 [Singulisphaera sp. GP187]
MNCAPYVRRLALLTVFAFIGCGRPPQIGEDRASFKAVDALYTAVSLRDPKLLDQCAGELHDLQTKGTLTEAIGGELEAIIVKAKEGGWEAAQSRLGDFMRGQTR